MEARPCGEHLTPTTRGHLIPAPSGRESDVAGRRNRHLTRTAPSAPPRRPRPAELSIGEAVELFTEAKTAEGLSPLGGVLAASRLLAVHYSPVGDLLLNSIAAAVISGTSLFGGHGRAWGALPGALVIGLISNGMGLLSFAASVKSMITGLVLVAAVLTEVIVRRGALRTIHG